MWKSRKYRRSHSKKIIKIWFIIPLLLIPVLIFLIFKFGLFQVKKIQIAAKDIPCVSSNDLKSSTGLLGQNLLFINSASVARNIMQKFFCIKSLTITKHLPDEVIMQIVIRQPFAKLSNLKENFASASALIQNIATPSAQDLRDSYLVDDEGIVFAKAKDENVPVVYLKQANISLGQKLTGDLNINLLKVLNGVKKLGIDIQNSWAVDNFFIINSSPQIIFNLVDKVDIQLASLQLILAEAKIDLKEPEVIDLRYDKPIVRFAPKKNG